MIVKQGQVPVEYAADQVFAEATKSKHIPKNLGILKLHCRDEVLRRNSIIQAHIGFFVFKFGMNAQISELEDNQRLYIAGSSRDAKLDLSFDFQQIDSGTNVTYDFSLQLHSSLARSAEARFGGEKTHELIGGVVHGIVDNVQRGLVSTYGPPLQRPA